MGCILDEPGTDRAECSRKVASERRVVGAIRFLVNVRDLQLQCTSLVPVLMYGSETCYGKRRRDLELGLYRWTTSEDCWVLGGCIGSRMHG